MPRGPRVPRTDRSLVLARHGYLFTAALDEEERRSLHEQSAVPIRFLGHPTLLVTGDAGVRLFYDETRLVRHKAVPAPIAASLFGAGAVHGLDDSAHRHRKTLFLHALRQDELERLLVTARGRWCGELDRWRAAGGGEVYPAAVRAFGGSIIEWAGIDESESSQAEHSRWMADIVNGFGAPGPAYVKAALARRRCDRWAAELVRRERSTRGAPAGSWLERVASFLDEDGNQLSEHTAAVELLNILRPTVAVAWLTAFAALALETHPRWRERLVGSALGDPEREHLAEAFAHEVRRYYPFVPILAARARRDFEFAGFRVRSGQRVLLDVHGTNHGADWQDPWAFDPARFLDTDPCDIVPFVPQGGGPRETGHRCPGEGVSNGLLSLAVSELAELDSAALPLQDHQYSLRRMPTRPASGTRISL
ncbi:MAG: cytochrome [Nocardioides sp.]|jgi:fatty-acid peroxygenase|nr:cytochrome [Nocardioides sp.]